MKDWEEVKLRDHVDLLAGFAFKSSKFTNNPNDIPLVKGENLHQGYIDWENAKRWPANQADKHKMFQLQECDVVVAMDRPWIEAGLKYSWIHAKDPKSLLVQRVARLRGMNGLSTEYLRYIIGSPRFTNYIKPIVTGINVPHISGTQIKDFIFILPPVAVQNKISFILSAYDDLIENNNRRIKILQEMAQTIYREWFVNFRFPGHEKVKMVRSELGMIPEGWEVKKLGNVCKVIPGYAFKSKDWQKKGLPVIKIKNINSDNTVNIDEVDCVLEDIYSSKLEKYLLKNGAFLIAMTGATAGKVGKLRTNKPMLLNQRVAKIDPEDAYQSYIWSIISTDECQKEFYNLADGAAQPNMSGTQIEGVKLILPPLALCEIYNQTVNDMFSMIDNYYFRNDNLRKTRDLLLPKLISWEIDVEGMEIEGANQ